MVYVFFYCLVFLVSTLQRSIYRMDFINKIKAFACISLVSVQSYAGIGLETTRVIFNQNDKSESVTAFNTSANMEFLLQSWIEGEDKKFSPDFIVTPPLMKLGAEKKNAMIITKIAELTDTVERLYWLNVRFIPASDKTTENVLRYSMTKKIKLIYRPKDLEKVDFDREIKKLVWEVQGDQLVVSNPTAYIINLNSIDINSESVADINYLRPQAKTNFKLKSKYPAHPKIKFSYINDYGAVIATEVVS